MRALVVVDVQNDFLPGGALPVPRGDEVVPVINALLRRADLVVATQEWHPADHGSFAASWPDSRPGQVVDLDGLPQVLQPVHCVQGTPGASFATGLEFRRVQKVVRKGQDPRVDSDSGLFDQGRRHDTGLGDWLRTQGPDEVLLAGLATDGCVAATARDVAALGFRVVVVEDACRARAPEDGDRAIEALRAAGVAVIRSDEVV